MHSLIIGMTESGKTTLAKILCKGLKAKGKKVAILDPLNDPGWGKVDFMTHDPASFLDYAKKNQSVYCFIDEGSISIGRYDTEMQWFATQSRHWGHSCFFITQGVTQISPIVRDQCTRVFCFAVGEKETVYLSENWREKELRNLEKIGKGEFYIVSRYAALKKGSIDFAKQKVYYAEVTNAAQNEGNRAKPKKSATPDHPDESAT